MVHEVGPRILIPSRISWAAPPAHPSDPGFTLRAAKQLLEPMSCQWQQCRGQHTWAYFGVSITESPARVAHQVVSAIGPLGDVLKSKLHLFIYREGSIVHVMTLEWQVEDNFWEMIFSSTRWILETEV